MKEGSVLEGIFAMYCALILIDPEDGRDTSFLRREITSMRMATQLVRSTRSDAQLVTLEKRFPKDENFGFDLDSTRKWFLIPGRDIIRDKQSPDYGQQTPSDKVQCELNVTLKADETLRAFGDNFRALNGGDFGKIATKMERLISSRGTFFFKKLINAKNKFLKNNRQDEVVYQVVADGIAGESSGGNIKADITIKIIANGREIVKDQIDFSLKSDSVTVENRGMASGMEKLYEMFSRNLSSQDKRSADVCIEAIRQDARGRTIRRNPVITLYRLIRDNGLPNGTQMSDELWDWFLSATFGDDKAQVVDIGERRIKELEPGRINAIRKYGGGRNGSLELNEDGTPKPQPMKLIARVITSGRGGEPMIAFLPEGETSKSKMVYGVRLKVRPNSGPNIGERETKLMIEAGGKDSIISTGLATRPLN